MTLTTLKTICAWCRKVIQEGAESLSKGAEPVSHGICRACRERLGWISDGWTNRRGDPSEADRTREAMHEDAQERE